jgi:putative molybdopterin biosynthesis protein
MTALEMKGARTKMSETVLLTMSEVSARLGISTARGYELAREKIIPVVRLGRQLRVDPEELKNFIKRGGQSLPGGWRKSDSTV